jgi:hypothetical protein
VEGAQNHGQQDAGQAGAGGVPPQARVGRAEGKAGQVFRRAGIAVTWLNCRVPAVSEEASRACREAVFPEHLHLRIVRKSFGLNAEAMGISFQAED